MVDLQDFERVKNFKYSWCATQNKNNKFYYAAATVYGGMIDGKPRYTKIFLSKFILGLAHDSSVCVDHKNFNTMDNRRFNFRITNNDENTKHRSGKNKNNTSGYRNVSWCKRKQHWMVQLQVNKKNKVLGYFDDKDEAGKFAELMRQKYYGEFAGID